MTKVVGIKFKNGGKLYYFSPKKVFQLPTGYHIFLQNKSPSERKGSPVGQDIPLLLTIPSVSPESLLLSGPVSLPVPPFYGLWKEKR